MGMADQYRFKIDGMSCAGCAARAARALEACADVARADVNFATGIAAIDLHRAEGPEALIDTLDAAGYPVRQAHVTVQLSGMSCAGCAQRIEQALGVVPGVLEARVNFATGQAQLRCAEGVAAASELIAAVRGVGYQADIAGETPQQDPHKAEQAGLARQLIWAAALTLPVFVLEMGSHLIPALHHWIAHGPGAQISWMVQFALTTLVLAGPGRVFFQRGLPALWRGAPDMNALVALGTGAAWLFSVVALFAPGLLPAQARAVYFEPAAVIVVLILTGRWLEAGARGRTGAAVRRLLDLQPAEARVLRDGGPVDLPPDQIAVGETLLLRPGERIALDGVVTEGESHVDESMVTGESAPLRKLPGELVIGGTVNGSGALQVRVTHTGADTTLAQIARMVAEAQSARLPVQALVDRVTLWFVPAVLGVAALTVALWLMFGPTPVLSHALVAGVAVLIVACPCAMGLATPTSIVVATGRAAELGVLFRKGDALQRLADVDVLAFDKTGTLTEGRPKLTDLHVYDRTGREDLLRLLAAVEQHSEHPVAGAILRAAEPFRPWAEAQEVKPVPGQGISARVGTHQICIGTAAFLQGHGIDTGPGTAQAGELAQAGKTPLFVAKDGRLAAVLAVSDPLRPGAAGALARLRALGVRLAMISGDTEATARAVAAELGITEVVAGVRPEGKVAALEDLRAGGARLAFVGDGINDAPALACADVGLAIGSGTDVAIEAADIVLMSGDPQAVVTARHVSTRTLGNIRQNLFWAFGYNVALIPVAAGALYPAFGIQLSPVLAAGAMALSSVFVLANALRLRALGG